MADQAVRTTVILPARVAEMLRRLVPARRRSAFISEAIEQHLAAAAYREARLRSFGAWSDEEHPDLRIPEDVVSS